MRKVVRGYTKDKSGNLIVIGTIAVPHSKDKRSPKERQEKRHLIRKGATTFKEEFVRWQQSDQRRHDCSPLRERY